MPTNDYLYVTDDHGVTPPRWHRSVSAADWALCSQPPKHRHWMSTTEVIEGPQRQCRQCKKIAKTLNQMGVNRK